MSESVGGEAAGGGRGGADTELKTKTPHVNVGNNKATFSFNWVQAATDMHPLAPTRNKIIYKTVCSDGPNSGSGKPFSKPASLKRASLVALPVAITHKPSLKPKRCASATLIQKTSKNEPKHGPKNGTAWRSHFWDRVHSLVKNKRKAHSRSHCGTKNDRKIAKSTAKADPWNQKKMTIAFS